MGTGSCQPDLYLRLFLFCNEEVHNRGFVIKLFHYDKYGAKNTKEIKSRERRVCACRIQLTIYLVDNSSIADSTVGYKKVKPVDLIFLSLTVALFKISTLRLPITNFNKKTGT